MDKSIWEQIILEGLSPENAVPAALPILLAIQQWDSTLSWREKHRHLQTLLDMVRQQLLGDDREGACFLVDENHLLCILTEGRDLSRRCEALTDQCRLTLPCDISLCIGSMTSARQLNPMVDQLFSLEKDHIDNRATRYLSETSPEQSIPADLLPRWEGFLQNRDYDRLLLDAEQFFLRDSLRLSFPALLGFHQSLMQLLYRVMAQQQIPAHVLFDQPENTRLFRDAPNSIPSTITWLFHAITALSAFHQSRQLSHSYTAQIRAYILSHLSSPLSRQELADQVHLSQNHLARLFRQEVGMSISAFILEERMKQALELLHHTDLPVGQVARQVGYDNYSYFLTLFRRVSGMTPSQYRQTFLSKEEPHG